MSVFNFTQNELHAEQVPCSKLAKKYGTPLYVYSQTEIEAQWHIFSRLLPAPHQACYAVKANSNLAVLQLLVQLGAGFDVVSGGEIARVLAAGGDPEKIVFSGVAKSAEEIRYALSVGVGQFNIESPSEIELINQIGETLGKQAAISIRVNPDVDAKTHPYISTGLEQNKFGISMEDALACYKKAARLPYLKVEGAACHIGSQLTDIAPFLDAQNRMFDLIKLLANENIHLKHLDMGGGLGVAYQSEQPPQVADYIHALLTQLEAFNQKNSFSLSLYLEPGRSIVANAGILLTKVELLKTTKVKQFVVVDAGMNDLLRPALYQAWHRIENIQQGTSRPTQQVDIVGPVCETGDFLGQSRFIQAEPGDILAVFSAGAYAFSMSSNYNSRPRAAEVLVQGNQSYLVRERETLADLWHKEILLENVEGKHVENKKAK